jgi:integrase
METDKAIYVFKHYGHLMTERERMANRHLIGTAKATSGRSDVAAQREVIHRAPKISRLPGERIRDRVLNHAEEEAYLAACDPLLGEVATVLVDTGMRPEELFRARWENVRFTPAENARFGYIFNPYGKTKYARRNVPMTARVSALLEMRHAEQGSPVEGWVFPAETKTGRVESLKTQHARALRASRVKHFVLYSLRHTLLTRLGEA